jgi:phosphate transport system substrate-binding protein
VAPLEAEWAQAWAAQNPGDSVTYGAVGSGAGITAISGKTVDFGASDAPLTPAQAAGCATCEQIPWALSATALGFHLGSVRTLKLTPAVIAQIYLGQITKWNDKRISKLNKGVRIPAETITPVFRSDGSGDTYAFTDFLSSASTTWASKVGRATTVSFPTGVGAKGNAGVTAEVSSTEGSIGYISASYLIAQHLPAAAVQNKAGNYEYPNLNNIENAAQSVTSVPANREMHIVNPPKKFKIAYPISTFTYVIVPAAPPQGALLKSFIGYAISSDGQSYGNALDFAKLPGVVLSSAQAAVSAL